MASSIHVADFNWWNKAFVVVITDWTSPLAPSDHALNNLHHYDVTIFLVHMKWECRRVY